MGGKPSLSAVRSCGCHVWEAGGTENEHTHDELPGRRKDKTARRIGRVDILVEQQEQPWYRMAAGVEVPIVRVGILRVVGAVRWSGRSAMVPA